MDGGYAAAETEAPPEVAVEDTAPVVAAARLDDDDDDEDEDDDDGIAVLAVLLPFCRHRPLLLPS